MSGYHAHRGPCAEWCVHGMGPEVGIATRLQAGRSGVRMPAGTRDFPLLRRPRHLKLTVRCTTSRMSVKMTKCFVGAWLWVRTLARTSALLSLSSKHLKYASIRPETIPSTSSPVHHSLPFLPFDATEVSLSFRRRH
jgi:hypothetical protein